MTECIQVNRGCRVHVHKTDKKNKNKLEGKEWIGDLYLNKKE